jgi:hypothetical protein
MFFEGLFTQRARAGARGVLPLGAIHVEKTRA